MILLGESVERPFIHTAANLQDWRWRPGESGTRQKEGWWKGRGRPPE